MPAASVTVMPGNSRRVVPLIHSGRRWFGITFAACWLVFLVDPVATAWGRGDVLGRLGAVTMVLFGGAYLVAVRVIGPQYPRARTPGARRALVMLVAMVAMAAASVLLIGTPGVGTAPYIAVVAALHYCNRPRAGLIWVVTTGGLAELLVRWFDGSWTQNSGVATAVLSAGMSVWGLGLLLARNQQTMRAQASESALALSQQQDRFARDLHDILGHSLTVITIKAELAGRLVESSPERAKAEIADLERLSREALADVRRAVRGYREVSLAGELARAKEALRLGEVSAEVPVAIDDVPEEHRELFAWGVREAVTNVLRHASATTCVIRVVADRLEVLDDGKGIGQGTGGAQGTGDGSGIRGLRERAAAAGAELTLTDVRPHGTLLTVSYSDPGGRDPSLDKGGA